MREGGVVGCGLGGRRTNSIQYVYVAFMDNELPSQLDLSGRTQVSGRNGVRDGEGAITKAGLQSSRLDSNGEHTSRSEGSILDGVWWDGSWTRAFSTWRSQSLLYREGDKVF